MKLIYCDLCGDVTRLVEHRWRTCECGECGGQYNKDKMTATIGGAYVRVFGIANTFFDHLWLFLDDAGRRAVKDAYKFGPENCWWGMFKGDIQIFKINSGEGPRLKVKIVKLDKHTNKVIITDKRDFTVDNQKIKEVVVPSNPVPSYKGKKKKK